MRIIEAILFNNELELLEARLREGDGVVDRWVVIESPVTFAGAQKPCHFAINMQRFSEFYDRIDHIIADPAPPGYLPWDREAYHRSALGPHLIYLDADDVIVLSDGDELTRRSCWQEIVDATDDGQCVSLHKPTWYYTLTWALPDAGPTLSSYRSKAARVSTLRKKGSVAKWADDLSFPAIENSGWHLSCLGGPARLLNKMRSSSHQEINTPEWATYENCMRLIRDGVDCAPLRNVPLTRTEPAGPEWLITEGIIKYPWLLTGEDSCTPLS